MIYVLGGGSDLNLKVVNGTSAPSSPKENTLWVNTSTAIPSWDFSSEQPSSPASGQVWIKPEGNSDIVTNVLKKNGIWLGVGGVKQYINGAWTDKDAQIYHAGAWNELLNTLFLFKPGTGDNTAVTGGWTGIDVETLTVGDTLYIEKSGSSSSYGYGTSVYHQNAISLLGYSSIELDVSQFYIPYSADLWFLRVCESETQIANGEYVAEVVISGTGKTTLNVDALNGSYYIVLRTLFVGGHNRSASITVTSLKVV